MKLVWNRVIDTLSESRFPIRLEVDWVRVYQAKHN